MSRGDKRQVHRITDIVATVYCERKALLDRERGDARPASVRAKADRGTREHSRFEREGYAEASRGGRAADRRCFIASAVYGPDAPETVFLRAWRDRRLMPSALGRMAVRVYYTVSPWLVPLLHRRQRLVTLVRIALSRLLARMGYPE